MGTIEDALITLKDRSVTLGSRLEHRASAAAVDAARIGVIEAAIAYYRAGADAVAVADTERPPAADSNVPNPWRGQGAAWSDFARDDFDSIHAMGSKQWTRIR